MRILLNRIRKSTFPIFIGLGVFISFPSLWAVASNSRNAINARYEGLAGVNFALGGSPMDVALNPANLYLTKGKKNRIRFRNVTRPSKAEGSVFRSGPKFKLYEF
ncbi:hypothetical protein LEP1GSC018_4008 [Leptospira kirschneri str. 2008720114]|nr:hypothetical protein LEP1GSC018_4008 [Leptospira kirschneri str. 2008720114]